jgi:hypothetical protein
MKMIIPPPCDAPPRGERSLLGRWRWNALAALFAALVLVALVVRRWRCAEVDEASVSVDQPAAAGGRSIGLGVGLTVLLASAMAVCGLLFLPLATIPVLAGSDANSVAIGDLGDLTDPSGNTACGHCGVVESTREIVDDSPVRGVEITLRTRDGASHLFTALKSENSAGWRTGERVIYIAGRRLAND